MPAPRRQPSPENPRSPCSHPASASRYSGHSPSGRRNRPAHAGPRTCGTARSPRRDTRVPGVLSRSRETDFHARTEHKHINASESLKHLKYVVLGYHPRVVDRRQAAIRHPHYVNRVTDPPISTHAVSDLRNTINRTLAQPDRRRSKPLSFCGRSAWLASSPEGQW
jgi:hypothetical protein